MDVNTFSMNANHWRRNKTGQRLGQYLLNQMQPPVTDSEIFYMRDNDAASALFFERYVKKE